MILLLGVELYVMPNCLEQAVASVTHGLSYARLAEIIESPTLETVRWLRGNGATIFAICVLSLGWLVFELKGD